MSKQLITKSNNVSNPLKSIFDYWPTKWNSFFDFAFDPVPIKVGGGDENITVEFEVPGFSKEDINVSIEHKVLNVECKNDKRQAYYSSTIPYTADPEKVDVKLENGILTVTFGRSEESKPKKLEIK